MASVTTPVREFNTGGPAEHRRVTADEQRVALALLLVGRNRPYDPAVDQFMTFAAEQGLSLSELWAAFVRGEAVASALVTPSAGRTGMLFMSPPLGESMRPIESALIRTACAAQDPRNVRLIQALLDPNQNAHRATVQAAGFTHLSTLIYMQGPIPRPRHTPELESGLEVHAWSQAARPIFAENILASYESTLDCPGLLGLRHIDDILAGHMASGVFTPELWAAVTHRGRPVGVALVNLAQQRDTAELVYLGLCPPWRGRGIGRQLLNRAMALASARQATTMVLAVDDRNAPALRLYGSMRFAPTTQKVAMIFPVP
ncbi:MAG: GNAT family N-acetyltransferase [Planctomycetes bacterium]|nr:GNAT family N-acetyltransferase [Planctomycetota bacterium]